MEIYRDSEIEGVAAGIEPASLSWLTKGSQRCQCGACGSYFARPGTFTMHRTGGGDDRRCLSPEEMTAKGWRLRASEEHGIGYWVQGGDYEHGQQDAAR